uniref:AAA+ ATPase domain-containing protein n=1 Tax=viral metagenome TaxID=1070528 RepID=A0A6C0LGK5_9ZZZZ
MNKHKQIFESYLNEENVFITGPGGTGKTYSIKQIYEHAISNNRKICVTALTGVASVLLDCNATTIHSWSGIGISNKTETQIINKINRSKFYKHNWENTDILIIDEISMMSCKLFELLNKIGQVIRCNKKPFGGIQVIFSGDFFQLPPVKETIFCFESELFNKTFDKIINLTKVFRQNDNTYKKLLLNMRKGLISKKSIELLNSKMVDENFDKNTTNITRLVPTKNKAFEINNYFINNIKDKKYIYKRTYKENSENLNKIEKIKLDLISDTEKESEYNYIKESTLSEENLVLKKGSYVMCIANLDLGLGIANGTTGIVVDFTQEKLPVVQFDKHKIEIGKKEWKSENVPGISVFQIPLILAWGITIHKAQGLTLDKAIVDIGKDLFEAGQMYVALSRIKSLEGVYLKEFNINNLKINYKVLSYYKILENDK